MASVDASAQHLKYAPADATMAVEDASPVGKPLPGAESSASPATAKSGEAKAKKPGFFEKLRLERAEKAAEK